MPQVSPRPVVDQFKSPLSVSPAFNTFKLDEPVTLPITLPVTTPCKFPVTLPATLPIMLILYVPASLSGENIPVVKFDTFKFIS